MEAQQCVKLSLTNRSIGLIPSTPQGTRRNTNTIASRDESVLRFAKSKAFGVSLNQTQKTSISPLCASKAAGKQDPVLVRHVAALPKANGSDLPLFWLCQISCRSHRRLALPNSYRLLVVWLSPNDCQPHRCLAAGQTAVVLGRPGGYGEGSNTRSHPELGRENPQRRWYCVLRRGRVGRRQVFQAQQMASTAPTVG